jgi:hypothetical protein
MTVNGNPKEMYPVQCIVERAEISFIHVGIISIEQLRAGFAPLTPHTGHETCYEANQKTRKV